ncbi:MAG: FKBP-type peptidyl-prolyl cis-trans isomerase, partial [Propionibacteriaceae bacterium]|nr:FKBP-type peptidyl-prolyl cis-trans isomerase [Propionibacteriaceae bacterium]
TGRPIGESALAFPLTWQAGSGYADPVDPFARSKAAPVTRRLRALVPTTLAVALFSLSACGSDEPTTPAEPGQTPAATASASAEPTPTAVVTTSAKDLAGITVEGEAGKEPKVTVPAPFGVDETMTRVITPGNGSKVAEGGMVEVHYVGVNGRTGEKFDDSWSRGETAQFSLGQVVPGFAKGLAGRQVGSRVLIAMPGKDGYDDMGGSPQAGIEVGDTLVFVVDITDAPLDRAEGDPVAPRDGLPTVAFDGDKPKITIPAGAAAPKELIVQPLIQGKGKPVQATDAITARYQAVLWKDGSVIDDTYGGAAETQLLSALIPAWQEGLKDKPVGSRVLIVSPPDKAYPADPGARKPNPAAGEAVVYVVDILHTQAGQ